MKKSSLTDATISDTRVPETKKNNKIGFELDNFSSTMNERIIKK